MFASNAPWSVTPSSACRPLSEHLQRLLDIGLDFHIASIDLTPFKAYNDAFGFGRGDEVILRLAEILRSNLNMPLDYLGHRGADTFVIIFRSADWEQRCESIRQQFAEAMPLFFSADALQAEGFFLQDVQGNSVFHPLLELVIGVAAPDLRICRLRNEVEALVASARREAKQLESGKIYITRRRAPRPVGLPDGTAALASSAFS